jgi:hypothetical protein
MKYTKRRKLRKTRKNRKQRKTRKARGGRDGKDNASVLSLNIPNPLLNSNKVGVSMTTKTSNETIPSVAPNILFTISRVPTGPEAPKGPEAPTIPEASFEPNEPKYEIFSQEEKALLKEIDEAIDKEPNTDTDNPSVELSEKLTKLNALFNRKIEERDKIEAEIKTKIAAFKEPPSVDTSAPAPKESDRQIRFMEIPEVSNTSSQLKGGNNPQPMSFVGLKAKYSVNSIQDIVSKMTTELSKNPLKGITLDIANNNTATVIANNQSATQQLVLINLGGNNALYDTSIFRGLGFDKQNHILRISITSSKAGSFTDFVYECCYGIIAADKGIGPNIYLCGAMRSNTKQDEYYLYSIIERIDGCDIHKFLSKKSPLPPPPGPPPSPSFGLLPPPPGPPTSNNYCSVSNYPADTTIDKFKEIINTSIDKLKEAGTECGFLMMDSKPQNILMTKDATKIYVIDYDNYFMVYEEPQASNAENREMYGKINVILFLANAYDSIANYLTDDSLKRLFGKYIFEKLQNEYYNHATFTKIQTYIQTLYFDNPVFIKLCHHYLYTECGLLKIRYFTKYELSFNQMNQYAGDNMIFFGATDPPSPQKSYKFPVFVSADKDDGILIRYIQTMDNGSMAVEEMQKTYETKYKMTRVFSLNRLCITNPSQQGILFDPYTPANGLIIPMAVNIHCADAYEEYICNVLIPEFKYIFYKHTDNEKIKQKWNVLQQSEGQSEGQALFIHKLELEINKRSPIQKWLEKWSCFQTDMYLEGVSLAAAQYHRDLTDAFEKNYKIQSHAIKKHIALIDFTNKLFNDTITSDVFSTKNICSEQPNTIAQLQTVLENRNPNPKPVSTI